MVNVSGVSRTCSLSGGYTQLTVSVVTCVYLHVNQFVLSCPSVFQISKLSPCPQAVFTVEDSAFHSLFFGRPVRLSDIYPNCDTCTSGSTLFGFRQSCTFSVHTGFSSCISCFRWFLSCLVLLQFSRDDLCFFHVSHTVVVLQLRTVWLVGFFSERCWSRRCSLEKKTITTSIFFFWSTIASFLIVNYAPFLLPISFLYELRFPRGSSIWV